MNELGPKGRDSAKKTEKAGLIKVNQPPEKSGEATFAEADWKPIPLSEIGKIPLAPFQVITDIPTIGANNRVEEAICRQILLAHNASLEGEGSRAEFLSRHSANDMDLAPESRIVNDRIADHLRPRHFNGSLLNAKAIVLPLDIGRAQENATRSKKVLDETDKEIAGFSVVYSGELNSSRGGKIGTLLQEAHYFVVPKPLNDAGSYRSVNNSGFLTRSLGPSFTVSDASKVMDKTVDDSQRYALRASTFALKHLYRGGGPGLGKHS